MARFLELQLEPNLCYQEIVAKCNADSWYASGGYRRTRCVEILYIDSIFGCGSLPIRNSCFNILIQRLTLSHYVRLL
jgi:hypothetical protein